MFISIHTIFISCNIFFIYAGLAVNIISKCDYALWTDAIESQRLKKTTAKNSEVMWHAEHEIKTEFTIPVHFTCGGPSCERLMVRKTLIHANHKIHMKRLPKFWSNEKTIKLLPPFSGQRTHATTIATPQPHEARWIWRQIQAMNHIHKCGWVWDGRRAFYLNSFHINAWMRADSIRALINYRPAACIEWAFGIRYSIFIYIYIRIRIAGTWLECWWWWLKAKYDFCT